MQTQKKTKYRHLVGATLQLADITVKKIILVDP